MSARDFAGVYDEHVWRVYGYFAYALGSSVDAEDLTQQTFERALRAWRRYDETRAGVATWLMVIARNLLIDHVRAGRRAELTQLEDADLEALPAVPDTYDVGLEPELEQAISALRPRERELLALRFGGDLTTPEIAAMTELSVANVQQILSRSLRRMRATIDAAAADGQRVGAG